MFEVDPRPLDTTMSAASQMSGSSLDPLPPEPSGAEAPSVMRFVVRISEWYSGSPCALSISTTAPISSSET